MFVLPGIYLLAGGALANQSERKTLRFHLAHVTLEGERIFEQTAAIRARTLTSVGGIREGRKYGRRKARKWGVTQRTVTPMMLVAAANEIAARRARNKSAAVSRRVNRRRV